MNPIYKQSLFVALALSATLGAASSAKESPAPWLKTGAEINFDATGNSANDYEGNARADANLRFELLMREGVRGVIKARIEQILAANGHSVDQDQDHDIEKIIEEAYISIETDKVSGLPRAVVTLGKHRMAFSQLMDELPMYRDNLLYKLQNEDEVIGFTVSLPANFLRIVDSVAMSVYETKAGDLRIGNRAGVSVQVTKQLSEKIKAQASALIKEMESAEKKESRGSMGLVFADKDGGLKIWAEGIVTHNNPLLAGTKFGGEIGMSKKLGPGTVVVDYQYLQDYAQELAAAYNIPVGKYLVLAPEVRRTQGIATHVADNTRIGVQAKLKLDYESKIDLEKTSGQPKTQPNP